MCEDEMLISEIRNGSRIALEQLIQKHYADVQAYIQRTSGSYHIACDVTQETFIRMMKGLVKYRSGRFRSWLFTIASNTLKDHYRSQPKTEPLNEQLSGSSMIDFEKDAAEREELIKALKTLPFAQREALVLKYYHGMTSKEIADITGTNDSTVKSRLRLGVMRMREMFGGDENGKGTNNKGFSR